MDDYFRRFEDRKPYPPLPYSPWRESLWQFLATLTVMIGGWYLWWRWTHSLNPDAMWFAVPMVLAETLAFFGLLLFILTLTCIIPLPLTGWLPGFALVLISLGLIERDGRTWFEEAH